MPPLHVDQALHLHLECLLHVFNEGVQACEVIRVGVRHARSVRAREADRACRVGAFGFGEGPRLLGPVAWLAPNKMRASRAGV